VEDADEPVREGAQGLVVGRALTQALRPGDGRSGSRPGTFLMLVRRA
jgi:hypothetical protein